MKISDLLGEGWEPDDEGGAGSRERTEATADPKSELDPWRVPPAHPSSARAQLADLAAGLTPSPPPEPRVEPEPSAASELPELGPVLDDLLPGVRKRAKSGASRSGSRRRAR